MATTATAAKAATSEGTEAKLRGIVLGGIEPTDDQHRVLAWILDHLDGKQVSEPNVKKLREAVGIPSIRVRRQYGMTHLEWGDYGYVSGTGIPGVSLLLAHSEKNVRFDAARIREKNPAYFGAAVARNAERRETLADDAAIAGLADALDRFLAAKADLEEAFAYGGPFAHDQCAIEKAFDLGDRR